MPLTYNVMPFPKFFAVNASGTPYAGGFLYFYASGTVTPQDTYSDSIGTPNTNPVVLDSAGRATIYLAPKAYAVVLQDSNHVPIWTVDPVYGFALTQDYGLCDGRLTLTTGVPVTTADVTAATTLYFTPYRGGAVALFDGTSVWGAFTFTEVSIAIPAAASQVYDVFASQTAGVVSLSLVAWTNDTTRATAITLQNGVYVKSGGTSFRYLGTIRTTAVAGQTEDSLAKRYVWNYAQRVRRPMSVFEATDSWTYTTATWRQANAGVTNQLDFVQGLAEDAVSARAIGIAANTNTGVGTRAGIGLDSTTAPTVASLYTIVTTAIAAGFCVSRADFEGYPGIGRHLLTWLEFSAATGTTTWYGDNGGSSSLQAGIVGAVHG